MDHREASFIEVYLLSGPPSVTVLGRRLALHDLEAIEGLGVDPAEILRRAAEDWVQGELDRLLSEHAPAAVEPLPVWGEVLVAAESADLVQWCLAPGAAAAAYAVLHESACPVVGRVVRTLRWSEPLVMRDLGTDRQG